MRKRGSLLTLQVDMLRNSAVGLTPRRAKIFFKEGQHRLLGLLGVHAPETVPCPSFLVNVLPAFKSPSQSNPNLLDCDPLAFEVFLGFNTNLPYLGFRERRKQIWIWFFANRFQEYFVTIL
jgi:hypothetical protein